VIDPPWKLSLCNPKNCRHGGRIAKPSIARELPYGTMTDEELEKFDIQQFADEECDLFLWTTKAKIHTAFHIMEKWGFHYANFFVWNKLDGLNNNGVHSILEFVLYGYKGRNGLDYKKPIEQYFAEKRKKHSQKPNLFYAMISKVTSAPRIDIFARRRHFGFDAYGDQVETQIQIPLLVPNKDASDQK
jgi:N6-adenosine-specific RNA methylase IME4